MKQFSFAIAALAFMAPALHAQTLPQHAVAAFSNGGQQTEGAYDAALTLTLDEGWITYWRIPGEAGVAPVFSTQGSENLKAFDVVYPAPRLHEAQGLRSLGYRDKIVLPLQIIPLDKSKPVRLKLHVDYAVCHDLCLPEQADFDEVLEKTVNTNTMNSIVTAKASAPQEMPQLVARSVFNAQDEGGVLDVMFSSPAQWQVAVLEIDARHAVLSKSLSGAMAHFTFKKPLAVQSRLRLTLIGEKTAATTQFQIP